MKTYLTLILLIGILVISFGWVIPILLSTANTILVLAGVMLSLMIPAIIVGISVSWFKSEEAKKIIKFLK